MLVVDVEQSLPAGRLQRGDGGGQFVQFIAAPGAGRSQAGAGRSRSWLRRDAAQAAGDGQQPARDDPLVDGHRAQRAQQHTSALPANIASARASICSRSSAGPWTRLSVPSGTRRPLSSWNRAGCAGPLASPSAACRRAPPAGSAVPASPPTRRAGGKRPAAGSSLVFVEGPHALRQRRRDEFADRAQVALEGDQALTGSRARSPASTPPTCRPRRTAGSTAAGGATHGC
jgi:hypothetical protein